MSYYNKGYKSGYKSYNKGASAAADSEYAETQDDAYAGQVDDFEAAAEDQTYDEGDAAADEYVPYDAGEGEEGASGYSGYSSGYSGAGSSSYTSSYAGFGSSLPSQDFSDMTALPEFVKDFYTEAEAVRNMDPADVAKFHADNEITIDEGTNCPNPIFQFDQAGFPDEVLAEIKSAGFDHPTPIQSQGWPIALSGKDMIGLAETGSGKTLAFALPAIVHIRNQPPVVQGEGPACLIVLPTRELAHQVSLELDKFGESSGITNCCVYGGVDRQPQITKLRQGVDIVVATPGRLIDLLENGHTNLRRVTYLVLDEADRLMDMGFEGDVRKLCSQIRPDKQVLMWSATWPTEVRQLASDFLDKPIRISVAGAGSSGSFTINRDIHQIFEVCEDDERFGKLLEHMEESTKDSESRNLIFVQTKKAADMLASSLTAEGYNASAIHGDKTQRERDWVLSQFRKGFVNVLIGTDVASRGLDVKNVNYVFNFDPAQDMESHVHRIGRTGRAGAKGTAVTFLVPHKYSATYILELLETVSAAGQDFDETMQNLYDKAQNDVSRGYGGNRKAYSYGRKSRGGGFRGKSSGGWRGSSSSGGWRGKSSGGWKGSSSSSGGWKGKSSGGWKGKSSGGWKGGY